MRTLAALMGVAFLAASFAYQDQGLAVVGGAWLMLALVGSVAYDVGRDDAGDESWCAGYDDGYEERSREVRVHGDASEPGATLIRWDWPGRGFRAFDDDGWPVESARPVEIRSLDEFTELYGQLNDGRTEWMRWAAFPGLYGYALEKTYELLDEASEPVDRRNPASENPA